jgi:uncharacterized protein (TIGR03790 family)
VKAFVLILLLAIDARLIAAPSDADVTLVVYREADRESAELAHFYGSQRGIAKERIVGIPCSDLEEITREEYDRTIAEPLRRMFLERGWWRVTGSDNERAVTANSIRFIALMKGVPLKISSVAGYAGDSPAPGPITTHNEAAVDAELATLGLFKRQISGVSANPYYRAFKPFPGSGSPAIMLVCRVDAPSFELARRMITDAKAVEASGLWGFAYIDSRSIKDGGLAEGDAWLNSIADDARKNGIPVIVDSGPDMFPAKYPMNHAALYYGWYNPGATGPFADPGFRFARGAVACHIHSFSAGTLRSDTQCWVGPLIARGAAATLGNVYEPYLALTTNLDILHNRLREGFNFAEAAYAGTRGLSWMTTFVGDPLYRPFQKNAQSATEDDPALQNEWAAYREGARLWFSKDRATGEKALQQAGKRLRSGAIFEGLAGLQAREQDFRATLRSFDEARNFYGMSVDLVRVTYRQANLLKSLGRTGEAVALARKQLTSLRDRSSAALLERFVDELDPPRAEAR